MGGGPNKDLCKVLFFLYLCSTMLCVLLKELDSCLCTLDIFYWN